MGDGPEGSSFRAISEIRLAGGHSGEGELVVRSLENTVVHRADHAFWRILDAGGLLSRE